MGQKIDNGLNGGSVGEYIGGNQTNNYYTMFQDKDREFVVTHNANIKPVSYFTGRETELQDLRQRIEDGRKSVLVSGMGGIGKTHICRKLFEEYFKKHTGPFQHIGYVEYDGDMGSSLQNCLKFKKQVSPEKDQEAAWRELEYLASGGKLLLFVDNVDKTIGADPGLQRLRSIPGAVVLTSRQASFSDEFEPYQIGFLDMEQCKEIYEKVRFRGSRRKVKPEEVEDLEYIIENLAGRHTITVELLAHLARTKLWTVQKLRDELEQKGFRLEFHKDGELVNIQESYEKIYDLSELTEAEQNILEAFSVFPYIPLAAELCNQWLLADVGISEDDDILMGLYQKGWLQFYVELEGYALHPVFAQFIYDKCKPVSANHLELIKACKRRLKIPKSGSTLECQKYVPFAENMIEKLGMGNNLEQADFIFAIAHLLYHAAEYKKAEALYEKSLQISKKVLGEDHLSTAASYNNLAMVYVAKGEYKKAELLYKKVLRISEKVLGEDHLSTAASYNNLAVVYDDQGEYEKAELLYKKSLRISEKVLGEEHPETAASYNGLAGVYYVQGEYEKAELLYKKSLRIREKALGEEHPKTAASYNGLAGVYYVQGEYEKAELLYEKSLRIREKVLGEEHPETATSYSNLALVYNAQGEYEKAELLHKKGLQIRKKVLGEEHPSTAVSYNDLAGVYDAQGEYEKAELLYEKSLRIREKVLGEEHPKTAESYNNLALVYNAQGEYEKAELLCKKGLRIRKKVLGEEHLSTAESYNNLAGVYDAQGEYEKAELLYEKGLRISERVLGEEHQNTAVFNHNLARLHAVQRKYELALFYYIKAYIIFLVRLGISHPNTKIALISMKIVYYVWNPEGNFEQWLEGQMKEEE